MMRKLFLAIAAVACLGAGGMAVAQPAPLGDAACNREGSAIRVNVLGLKDRTGELRLELYPPNEQDFLSDDNGLLRQGKVFRRVRVPTPAAGPVAMCIRVPGPGTYALLFTHNRDGKNKFNFWSDGAGLPGNERLGRSRPKVSMARVVVAGGVMTTDIRVQYLRGLSGFGPLKGS